MNVYIDNTLCLVFGNYCFAEDRGGWKLLDVNGVRIQCPSIEMAVEIDKHQI